MKFGYKTKALIRAFIASEDEALKTRLFEEFTLDHKDEWNAWLTNHKRMFQAATRKSLMEGANEALAKRMGITPEIASQIADELLAALEEIWAEMLITPEREKLAREHLAKFYDGITNPTLN